MLQFEPDLYALMVYRGTTVTSVFQVPLCKASAFDISKYSYLIKCVTLRGKAHAQIRTKLGIWAARPQYTSCLKALETTCQIKKNYIG